MASVIPLCSPTFLLSPPASSRSSLTNSLASSTWHGFHTRRKELADHKAKLSRHASMHKAKANLASFGALKAVSNTEHDVKKFPAFANRSTERMSEDTSKVASRGRSQEKVSVAPLLVIPFAQDTILHMKPLLRSTSFLRASSSDTIKDRGR